MNLRTTWNGPGTARTSRRTLQDRLQDILLSERNRWVLWLPVAFGSGIAIYFSLANEPGVWIGPTLLVFVVLGLILSVSSRRYMVPVIGISAIALGFSVAQWRTHDVAAPTLTEELRHRDITGVIAFVEPRKGRFRVTLEVEAIAGLAPLATPKRVRVTASSGQFGEGHPGQRVTVRATLRPPPEPALPGGFDFRRTAWFKQLGGVGFATGAFHVDLTNAPNDRGLITVISNFVQTTRLEIADRVTAAIPGPTGAVATALMVGERGNIPDETAEAMRSAGLAHLLAISGLHVGLVAGFVFFAIRFGLAAWPRVVLRYPVKKWAAVAALAASAIYLLLAGATVPTQRAFIMTGLILVAVLLDRRGISMRLVAWAAALILLLRPEALLSVSFQMSFAAVVALIAVYEVVGDRFRRSLGTRRVSQRIGIYLGSILLTTIVASLATAPFAIFHFNQFSTYSVVANLIAIPVAAFWVMPLIVVSLTLMPFGLEGITMPFLGMGVDLILSVAVWVSTQPGASLNVAAPPVIGLALAVIGGLWLTLWQTRWRMAGVGPIIVGLLSITTTEPPNLLVSPDGRLTGIVGEAGVLLVSSGRAQSFVRDQWIRKTGARQWRAFPSPGEGLVAGMQCDRIGCVFQGKDKTIAFVQEAQALTEDCQIADILIARFTVLRECTGPSIVIDRGSLVKGGSHILFWPTDDRASDGTAKTIAIENASGASGNRLWLRNAAN